MLVATFCGLAIAGASAYLGVRVGQLQPRFARYRMGSWQGWAVAWRNGEEPQPPPAPPFAYRVYDDTGVCCDAGERHSLADLRQFARSCKALGYTVHVPTCYVGYCR